MVVQFMRMTANITDYLLSTLQLHEVDNIIIPTSLMWKQTSWLNGIVRVTFSNWQRWDSKTGLADPRD